MKNLDKAQRIMEANMIVQRWKDDLGVICFDSAPSVDEVYVSVDTFCSIFSTYSIEKKNGYYYLTASFNGVRFLALATTQEVEGYDV